MRYKDFIKLNWKKFKRSPGFQKKMLVKILIGIAYFFVFLYAVGISFLAYYGVLDAFGVKDVFLKSSEYFYILLLLIIYK